MLKKLIPLLSIFLIFTSITVTTFAHSGKTDGNGGHYSGSSYHYHHGYPAHQHTNGQCPYNFVDKTNHGASNSSGITEKNTETVDFNMIIGILGSISILLGLTFLSNINGRLFVIVFVILLIIFYFLL